MSQDQTEGTPRVDSPNPPSQPPETVASTRQHRRRWWLRITVVLLGLIMLLVGLAPTLVSTAVVRKAIVARVNRNLAGKIEIADWSIGWRSGLRIDGLCVREPNDTICLAVRRIASDLTFTRILRGHLDLGRTSAEALEFTFRQYSDGTNSFSRLAKAGSPPMGKLPQCSIDLSGRGHGQVIVEGKPPIEVVDVSFTAKVSDINRPVDHRIGMICRTRAGTEGNITVSGKLGMISGNQLRFEALEGDEAIELGNVPLDAAGRFVSSTALDKVDGRLTGRLALALAEGKSGVVEGELRIGKLEIALVPGSDGQSTAAETYRTEALLVRIPRTTIDLPDGPGSWGTGQIKVGAGQKLPILIQTDQGQITATGELSIRALLNALANKKPDGQGDITLETSFDLSKLAHQMPRTLGLAPGTQLTGGMIGQSTHVVLSPLQARCSHIETIRGVRGRTAEGKPLGLKDMTIEFAATSLGGGGAVPDLRDISLAVESGFGNINIHGPSLSSLEGSGSGDLALLRGQLGEVLSLGEWAMTGKFVFQLHSTGDLAASDGSSSFTVDVKVNEASLSKTGTPGPISEPRLALALNATLHRGKEVFVEKIDNCAVRLLAGPDEGSPILDASFKGNLEPKRSDIQARVAVDLARAQRSYPMLMSFLTEKKILLENPAALTLNADATVGAGLRGGDGAILARGDLTISGLGMRRDGKPLAGPKAIALHFDLGRDASNAIEIRQLAGNIDGGKAVTFAATGRIARPGPGAPVNARMALSYDASRLLPVIQPFVETDLSSYKLTGVARDQALEIAGTYRTDVPWSSAVKQLRITGGLNLASFETMGLTLEKIDTRLELADGTLAVRAKPIRCNGGTLDIDGARLSITAGSPQLSLRKGPLVKDLELNPTLANMILGRGSLLFHNVREARGPLDVTVVDCKDLPLEWLAVGTKATAGAAPATGPGRAELRITLVSARLGSGLVFDVLASVGAKFAQAGSEISIRNARVVIADGQICSELPVVLERHKLGVNTTVRSSDGGIVRGELLIPKTLTGLPVDAIVPVKGTITAPTPDTAAVLNQLLRSRSPGDILKDLTGREKK